MKIINGNSAEVLKQFPDNHFDSVVTDPPYGINFLGKDWDSNIGEEEVYRECLRVLKPGGHLLAFSAARTYHHLAMTLERVGFEIRDQIMWIYSSGFPKSQDVGRNLHKKENGKPDKQRFDPAIMIKRNNPNPNVRNKNGDSLYEGGQQKDDINLYEHPETGKIYRKLPDINGDRLKISHEGNKYGVIFEEVLEVKNEWSGWGTSLKPAHEPICMARKPMKNSVAKNVQEWGTGAINVDACRVPYADDTDIETYLNNKAGPAERSKSINGQNIGMFDNKTGFKTIKKTITAEEDLPIGRFPSNIIGEFPKEYQKYFYCPKVSRSERHLGFDLTTVPVNEFNDPSKVKEHPLWDESIGSSVSRLQDKIRKTDPEGNNHPTVKPVDLMAYLVKLITPKGGKVLDPFNGSGSTGLACVKEGMDYVGIELDPKYVAISEKRIAAYKEILNGKSQNTFDDLFTMTE